MNKGDGVILHRIVIRTLFSLLVISLAACAEFTPDGDFLGYNYRGPFKGRVMDQDTNQPIEGVVVFVEWQIKHGMGRPTFFDAKEVLTDKDGNFYVPKNWSFNPWRDIVMDSQATIIKVGYGYVEAYGWADLKEIIRSRRGYPAEERRKKGGPDSYFELRFDSGLPVFLLRRLTPEEARLEDILYTDDEIPDHKKKLFVQEINKIRKPRERGIPGKGIPSKIQPQIQNSGDMIPIH